MRKVILAGLLLAACGQAGMMEGQLVPVAGQQTEIRREILVKLDQTKTASLGSSFRERYGLNFVLALPKIGWFLFRLEADRDPEATLAAIRKDGRVLEAEFNQTGELLPLPVPSPSGS